MSIALFFGIFNHGNYKDDQLIYIVPKTPFLEVLVELNQEALFKKKYVA